MARLRQKNAKGECQTCGLWPSRAVSHTATCPPGWSGDPVTVNLPAGAEYAATTELATQLAEELAQELAEAGLQCTEPDCTYVPVTSFAQAGETAWRQYLFQLTTNSDPTNYISERGILSADGKRIVFQRYKDTDSFWVVDTSQKPNDSSGSFRNFWAPGMVPFEMGTDSQILFPSGAITRDYDFIGQCYPSDKRNQIWRAADYSIPEADPRIEE